MTHDEGAFYNLWQSLSCLSSLDDFPVGESDAEDLEFYEGMVSEGLTKLMELKTRIANAKHELQASNLQRGVLPQAEGGEEGIRVEAVALEEVFAEGIAATKANLPKDYIEARHIRFDPQAYKTDFGQKEIAAIGIQDASGNLLDEQSVRGKFAELHEKSNRDSPQMRERE